MEFFCHLWNRPIPYLTFFVGGLVKSPLWIVYGPRTEHLFERRIIFGLDFEIELFKVLEHQPNPVQHLINRTAKMQISHKVEQECQILLVSQTHLHEVTKACTCIGQTERHVSKLI